MAIAYFKAEIIEPSCNVIQVAAQRHCTRMYDESNARWFSGIEGDVPKYEGITLPQDAPDWIVGLVERNDVAKASELIWNRIMVAGKAGGPLAREITVALPIEFSCKQNVALVREFVEKYIAVIGVAVDWVFHDGTGTPQARFLHTLRPLTRDGFGSKIFPVRGEDGDPVRCGPNKTVVYRSVTGGTGGLVALRKAWCELLNKHLVAAGLDVHVDMRFCVDRGVECEQRQRTARSRMANYQRLRSAISRKT
ncbi:MobA/MobL family protein [Brucella intermedia]|uniref:MobA/MobL family protein n=1 Tax=Brucella TaxID=234 RepID=UPI0009461D0C|nr:MobA/MobL family protein [Brucella intermedia]